MSAPQAQCLHYDCNSSLYSNIKTIAYVAMWVVALAALAMAIF